MTTTTNFSVINVVFSFFLRRGWLTKTDQLGVTETDQLRMEVVTKTCQLGTEMVTEMDQVGVEADYN